LSENKISITSNNSYAQALFELANEDKSLAKVEEQVVAISRLINESEEFRYLINIYLSINQININFVFIKVMIIQYII